MSSQSSHPSQLTLPRLLGDALLEGQYEVTTLLRPERLARPVSVADPGAVHEEITRLCQVWGGAAQPLLPVRDGAVVQPYRRLLDREQIDGVGGLQGLEFAELPSRVENCPPSDYPVIVIAAHEPRDRWRPVEVCDLDPGDPWRAIYAAVLGYLPDVPDPELLKRYFLRENVRYDEIVPIHRVVVTGSLDDLVTRTTTRDVLTPRQFSNMFLAYGLAPDTSFLGNGPTIIPAPRQIQRAAGPNLIVVVSDGAVEDLALLWNLRCAHGDERVLPIGIPADQVTPEQVADLQQPGRATMFGMSGGSCHIVSCTVAPQKLRSLTEKAPAARSVPYEEVLTCGPAAGRPRSHVCLWQNGRTRIETLSDGDREVLRGALEGVRAAPLIVDVWVHDAPLPADPTMRGSEFFGRFQAGAAQVSARPLRGPDTVEVAWPTSWTCLAAVAQSRGIGVRESATGLAAATLIRSIGDIEGIHWIGHHGLIALLYRMAERSGMSWWKKRWSDARRQIEEQGGDLAAFDKTARLLGRDDPAVAPPGDQRAVKFSEFARTFGGDPAARHWLSWAERRHLVVRGADIECPECQASAWLPMAAIPPPVPCAGCGREILHPYGPRELLFSYRLGEPLRRVLEADGLGPVLALRWFVDLFGRSLVGAYPGVEFVDATTGAVIGEADVLLLFVDGTLVPVEAKRTGAGLDDKAIKSMDAVAAALDAPWDALVVSQPARDCGGIRAVERRLPERPRLLITTDQLFNDHVFWAWGADPFSWNPLSSERDSARDASLEAWLRDNSPDAPWDPIRETLLDRAIGARHTRATTQDHDT